MERFKWSDYYPIAFPGIRSLPKPKGRVCVAAAYPDSPVARAFTELSQIIWQQTDLYPANPLSDDELETCVLGKTRVKTKSLPTVSLPKTEKVEDQFLSKSLLMREPLHGCAYNGAMNLAVQIRDSITISHGPRSCANLSLQSISSLGRRSLLEKSIVLPVQLRPNILSSKWMRRPWSLAAVRHF